MAEQAPGGPRRRRRDRPRGYTVSQKAISLEQLRIGNMLYPPIEPAVERPRTRADCRGAERPCPWVTCRHHLYLDVNPQTGSIKFNFPDLEPHELVRSCSLDIAEGGAITLDEVGELTNVTRERVRQVETKALLKQRIAHGLLEKDPAMDRQALTERVAETVSALLGDKAPSPGPAHKRRRRWEPRQLRDPVAGEKLRGWTVVAEAEPDPKGRRRVLVRCVCGAERSYFWGAVLHGYTPERCSSCCGRGRPVTP